MISLQSADQDISWQGLSTLIKEIEKTVSMTASFCTSQNQFSELIHLKLALQFIRTIL